VDSEKEVEEFMFENHPETKKQPPVPVEIE